MKTNYYKTLKIIQEVMKEQECVNEKLERVEKFLSCNNKEEIEESEEIYIKLFRDNLSSYNNLLNLFINYIRWDRDIHHKKRI